MTGDLSSILRLINLFHCYVIRTSQLTKRLVHKNRNITFDSILCDLRIQNHVNCFYLQKYSRELHSFPVLNEVDVFAWPYMLERLGCQKILGQTWPGPGHGTPNVNCGTGPVIPGRLATLTRKPPLVNTTTYKEASNV